MSNVPEHLKYTKEHEWISIEGDIATIGITDHAQESLGDITFVELPELGDEFAQDDTFGVVESVKAASDLYMPIAGEITESNSSLEDAPESLNSDPYGDSWIIKIKVSDSAELDSLLSAEEYTALIG